MHQELKPKRYQGGTYFSNVPGEPKSHVAVAIGEDTGQSGERDRIFNDQVRFVTELVISMPGRVTQALQKISQPINATKCQLQLL